MNICTKDTKETFVQTSNHETHHYIAPVIRYNWNYLCKEIEVLAI